MSPCPHAYGDTVACHHYLLPPELIAVYLCHWTSSCYEAWPQSVLLHKEPEAEAVSARCDLLPPRDRRKAELIPIEIAQPEMLFNCMPMVIYLKSGTSSRLE